MITNREEALVKLKWLAGVCQTLFPKCSRLSSRQLAALTEKVDWVQEGDIKNEKNNMERERILITALLDIMQLRATAWSAVADETHLPALAWLPHLGWVVITGAIEGGRWQIELPSKRLIMDALPKGVIFAPLAMQAGSISNSSDVAKKLFQHTLLGHRKLFVWAGVAALVGNLMALAGSLYSMQVYDRVLPTQNGSTLVVLMTGALLAACTEFIIKLGRHGVTDYALRSVDVTLSGRIYRRLLHIRMDQLPQSLGTLSSQIRGYETVRAFMSTSIMFFMVDAPFALIFLVVIAFLAGPLVASVPVVFALLSISVGIYFRKRIAAHAMTGNDYTNRRQGMLVETIQNAESIKASGMSDLYASRWHIVEQNCADNNMAIRHHSEQASYFAALVQQASYIVLVSVGAWVAITSNSLTSGALVACSMLSGRVLAPVATMPGLLVQWAHARAALDGLEKIYALELDNHGVDHPLAPEHIHGDYNLTDIRFSWQGGPDVLRLGRLQIRAGEKVAVLGSVGTGKSTLLRLLAGLYRPVEGRVLLDGLDIQQIARNHLSERVGYLSQESRLLAGSLKDNLLSGLYDVNEERLMNVCRATGLDRVVASHPRGLGLEIAEGGSGLSGGQKQQVALARLLLASPDVWLLDEPTSAMDDMTENRCLQALHEATMDNKTLILVTHKPALLTLVDRIIVMGPQGIIGDGPRDQILRPRPVATPEPTVELGHPISSGGKQ